MTIPASSTVSVAVPTNGALLFGGTVKVDTTYDEDYIPFVLSGSNSIVAGLDGAVIDGNGADYWDGEGDSGGNAKPNYFFKLEDLDDSTFYGMTIQNWPTHLFRIGDCTNLEMYNLLLDNSAGNEEDSSTGDVIAKNTDGFDVSDDTDGLYLHDITIYNQDDCVAVKSGKNMVFDTLYCSGGHGLSIGGVDSDIDISNVTFSNSAVIDSQNGVRIKTNADSTDSTVTGVIYSNIQMSGITIYGLDIQQ